MSNQRQTGIVLGYNQFLCAESLAAGEQFSLSLFEDFNKLIESVVLYDQIVMLGDYTLPSGLLASPLRASGVLQAMPNAEMRTLVTQPATQNQFNGVMFEVFGKEAIHAPEASPLRLLELRISPNILDQHSYYNLFEKTIECNAKSGFKRDDFTSWIGTNIFQARDQGGHFYYLARAILYATLAEQSGRDYAPDLLRLPIAALAFSRASNALPRAVYDALVDKIQSEVEALTLLGMPVAVFVPPLTATLLAKVDSPADYASELLEIREKFAGFRQAYGEFLAMVQDPSIRLREKIDAKKKMISRITGIIDRGESGHALNVRTIWDKLISSSLGEDGTSTKLSLSGMVSLLLDQLAKEGAKGHARALFDLWTDTLNLKDYGSLVEKAFHTQIDPGDIERYKRYSEAIRSLVQGRTE